MNPELISDLTKELSIEATNKCHNDAIFELFKLGPDPSLLELDYHQHRLARARSDFFYSAWDSDEERDYYKKMLPIVSDLYQQKICSLPSDVIETIIHLNTIKVVNRMPKTIEALLSELARRELLQDSSESDPKITNG